MWYLVALAAVAAGSLLYVRSQPVTATQRCIAVARFLCGFRAASVIADRYRWHYLDSDSASSRPVVLLLHGYGAEKVSWLAYGRLLSRNYRVVIPDLPGFGDNSRDHYTSYTPRLQAQRVAAFCDALGITDVHVTGSSMGGFVSCWLAIEQPSLVASLTLMNSAGVFGANASAVQTQAEAGRNVLMVSDVDDFSRLLRMLSPKPPYVPRFMKRYAVSSYQTHAKLLEHIFWELAEAQQQDGLQERLGDIKAPTLIIWGDQDQIIDVSCAAVFDHHILNSEVLILQGKGHIPMLESPVAAARHQRRLISGQLAG